jgi:hypothetical protein
VGLGYLFLLTVRSNDFLDKFRLRHFIWRRNGEEARRLSVVRVAVHHALCSEASLRQLRYQQFVGQAVERQTIGWLDQMATRYGASHRHVKGFQRKVKSCKGGCLFLPQFGVEGGVG